MTRVQTGAKNNDLTTPWVIKPIRMEVFEVMRSAVGFPFDAFPSKDLFQSVSSSLK